MAPQCLITPCYLSFFIERADLISTQVQGTPSLVPLSFSISYPVAHGRAATKGVSSTSDSDGTSGKGKDDHTNLSDQLTKTMAPTRVQYSISRSCVPFLLPPPAAHLPRQGGWFQMFSIRYTVNLDSRREISAFTISVVLPLGQMTC